MKKTAAQKDRIRHPQCRMRCDYCAVVPATASSDQASPVTLSTVDPYAIQEFDFVAVAVTFWIKTCCVAGSPLPIPTCCIDIGAIVTCAACVGPSELGSAIRNVWALFGSRFTM